MSLPEEVLSAPRELPAEVDAAGDGTKKLLRRASRDFHDSNPYVPMVTRGSLYLPPEARLKFGEKGADEPETPKPDSSDDEDEVVAQKSAAMEDVAGMDEDLRTFRVAASGTKLGEVSRGWVYSVPWHVKIVADNFDDPKHVLPDGKLKPRRPMPHLRATELLQGLKFAEGRYFFSGVINEWPALQGVMLASITRAKKGWLGMGQQIERLWTAQEGKNGKQLPLLSELNKHCRATFLAPKWSTIGWAPKSPGFAYWFSQQHDEKPRILFGEKMLETLEDDTVTTRTAYVTRVHNYVHRYPVAKETARDRITFHALTVVEWSHSQFVTLLELAWLNGLGGYGGKSNWVEDKLDPNCSLWVAMNKMGPGMVQPWIDSMSEVRLFDMPFKTMAGFESYLDKYQHSAGNPVPLPEQRFFKWEKTHSGTCKLRNCTPEVLASYQLNYVRRVWGYQEIYLNCQTFNTDLYAFLTGERNVGPYGAIVKPVYKQHQLSFLFMPAASKDYRQEGG